MEDLKKFFVKSELIPAVIQDYKTKEVLMLAYMNEHFTGDCSMSRMAEELCYEKTYLAKFFSKAVGISPAEYVLQLRLSKACELLVSTEDSVINVGNASGFNSLRTFNRNFLERYGVSPSQYRALDAAERRRITGEVTDGVE